MNTNSIAFGGIIFFYRYKFYDIISTIDIDFVLLCYGVKLFHNRLVKTLFIPHSPYVLLQINYVLSMDISEVKNINNKLTS